MQFQPEPQYVSFKIIFKIISYNCFQVFSLFYNIKIQPVLDPPGPMIKPTRNAELASLIAELMPESIKRRMSEGAKASSLGGMCIIYEEYFSMPGRC